MIGLLYLNPRFYHWIMKQIYSRQEIKDEISFINSFLKSYDFVLDLCCGDCWIANHIKGIYLGYDKNRHFVKQARKKGFNAFHCDLDSLRVLPNHDLILLRNSLYHFNNPEDLIERMVKASRKLVIVSEPVENLISKGFVGRLLLRILEGKDVLDNKFNEERLRALLGKFGFQIIKRFGKNLVGVRAS